MRTRPYRFRDVGLDAGVKCNWYRPLGLMSPAPDHVGMAAVVPLIGLGLNYTQYGIRLVPVLLGLSLFTVLLALVACVRRGLVSEAEKFAVGGCGLGCGGDGSGGGRGRSGSGGEGRGGGLA